MTDKEEEVEDVRKYIKETLQKNLSHLISEPAKTEDIRKAVHSVLASFVDQGVIPPFLDDNVKKIATIMLLGSSERPDLKAMLEKVPDDVLEMLTNTGMGQGIIAAEWGKRKGTLIDYTWKWLSDHDGELSLQPKKQISYVRTELTLKKEGEDT